MAGIKKDMTGHGNESLPQPWKDILQRNFTTFRDHLRAQDIVPHLFSALVLSSHQLDEINAIPTEYGKTEYLMNKVLRRSSRDKLAKFKQALSDSGQSHLIKYLPSDLPFNYDDGVSTAAQREQTEGQQPLTQTTSGDMDTENHYEVIPADRDPENERPRDQEYSRPVHTSQSAQSMYNPEISSRYKRLPGHRGLCAIFGFFVAERSTFSRPVHAMPGYRKDMKDLENKFRNQLGFEVVRHKNLTKANFLGNLKILQQRLNTEEFDRFVLVVLSHGCENGVYTCADINGHHVETDAGQKVFVPYRDIRDYFTHDKATELKGLPKLLMLQCCRGEKQMATAGHGTQESHTYHPECDPDTFGIEADLLISYATESRYESAVDHADGSWFIQDFLQALGELDPSKYEIERILRRTNYLVSHRNHRDHDDKILRQTSVYHSSLRKEFYLKDDRD